MQAPPRFWRGALLYTEGCLVILYLLAVPCFWGCWGARVCGSHRWAFHTGGRSLFLMDVAPLFLAYLATLMHVLRLDAVAADDVRKVGE